MKPSTARHILIVEDDRWFAESAQRTLQAHGWRVSMAHDAHEALDRLEDGMPDLLLLDLFLPQANGLQLLHELRGYDDSVHLPVVLISSALQDTSAQDLQAYGVVAVCDKAVLTPAQLVRTVREVLEK